MPGPGRIAAVAATALAAGGVLGCGGGPEHVSAEELVSQGDAICQRTQQRFTEIQSGPLTSAGEGVEQTEALIEAFEDGLNELRDLEPPEELSEPYDRYLESLGRALEFFREGEDAAEAQDGAAYIDAQNGVAKSAAERQQLAQAVGFQVCSNPQAADQPQG